MEDIKYHPLVDRDTEGMDKVPMFFSGSEATIRENHDMYLEEMVPKHYRLCSVNGTAPKIADGFTIHCPYCGNAMRCIANLTIYTVWDYTTARTAAKKKERNSIMSNYPLKANKENWRTLRPQKNLMSEEYIRGHYDLYLTTEYSKDKDGQNHRFYRLHAMNPHTIEMALAYDIKCPCCGSNTLKQVGRCLNSHELGLYECPVCDRK